MKRTKQQINCPVRAGLLLTSVDFGGLEQVVLRLIENVDQNKFVVTPVVFSAHRRNSNNVLLNLEKLGIKYYSIAVNDCRIKCFNPLVNLKQVYTIFKKDKFDLIHTHGYRADVIGYIVASALGLPIISTCHGFISNDAKLLFYNKIDRFVLRFFNKIIAVSKNINSDLIDAGVTDSRISVIPNAVRSDHNVATFEEARRSKRDSMALKDDHFVLGYVGRLSEEKGLSHLVEATSALLNSNIPVKLLLIGEGPQKQELELLSEARGIADRVLFLGFQRDIETLLPAMDVFVLPSLSEGTPMALLEAMSYGIPVVASEVGGIPAIIKSPRNGILIPPAQPEMIKDAVATLFFDKQLRINISCEARKTIGENYSVTKWARQMEKEYLDLLNQKRIGC